MCSQEVSVRTSNFIRNSVNYKWLSSVQKLQGIVQYTQHLSITRHCASFLFHSQCKPALRIVNVLMHIYINTLLGVRVYVYTYVCIFITKLTFKQHLKSELYKCYCNGGIKSNLMLGYVWSNAVCQCRVTCVCVLFASTSVDFCLLSSVSSSSGLSQACRCPDANIV